MIQPAFEILNQRGTPMFFSDVFANRPTAGIVGRIFISTDTKEFYRDTGSTWELLAGGSGSAITGSGTATQIAFFNTSSSITSDSGLYWDNTNKRLGIGTQTPGVALDIHSSNIIAQLNGTGTTNSQVAFQNAGTSKWQIGNIYAAGRNYFRIYDTASASDRLTIDNTGEFNFTGYSNIIDTRTYSTGTIQTGTFSKTLTIPASTSVSSSVTISSILSGGPTTFEGNATIPNSTTFANILCANDIRFSGAGTLTMTQAAGIRAASSFQVLNYFGGSASGTISHYAASSIYGFYNLNSGSITPVITNAYMHLINDMNDYSHTFTFTNRWGIYQAGANDKNYFAAKILAGTNTDAGSYIIQATGQIRLNSYTSSSSFSGTAAGYLAFDSSGNIITTASPSATTIYTGDGTLAADRQITMNGKYLQLYNTSGDLNFRIYNNVANSLSYIWIFSNSWPSGTKLGQTGTTYGSSMNDTAFFHSNKNIFITQSGFSNPFGADINTAFFVSTKNVTIGGIVDAGYKADIQGTGRITSNLYFTGGSFSNRSIYYSSTYGLVLTAANTSSSWDLSVIERNGNLAIGVLSNGAVQQNVTIFSTSTSSETINSSALIEIKSTTKGFLPPRMTGAQAEAITTPAEGLMVYANNGNGTTIVTTGWWGYNGTTWVKLN